LNILFVSPEFSPAAGGIASYSVNLVAELSKRHHVCVIAPVEDGIFQRELSRFPGAVIDNVKLEPTSNVKDADPLIRTIHHQLNLIPALKRAANRTKVDVIHASSPHGFRHWLLTGKEVPTVVTVHSTIREDVLSLLKSRGDGFSWRKTDFVKTLAYPAIQFNESRVLNKARRIIALDRKRLSDFEVSNRNRISFIPNGVSTSVFSPSGNSDLATGKVLFVSRLLPSKGIEIALEARRLVKTDCQFVFVGPGNVHRYQRIAERVGIGENECLFVGDVDYQRMPSTYRRAEVFCCPSLMENMPMTILEAMACGVPCVSTNVGSIPQIVRTGFNGVLVPPRSPGLLAEGISAILDDKKKRAIMSENARQTIVDRYSSERMAAATSNVYAEMVDG
jgi:glycosyltransferase involved in cell wall biosynthesis